MAKTMRTQTILRDKKGLSLIFVLAAMLLLLALGVSVLTAAGLSNRAVHAKDAANQRALYMESMSRVMYAVLDAEGPESLTEYLIKSIYDEFYDEFDPDDPTTWIPRPSRTIEIEVDDAILTGGLANDARFEITIFINTAAGSHFYMYNNNGFNVAEYVPNPGDIGLPGTWVRTHRERASIVFEGTVTVRQRLYYGDRREMETMTNYRFNYGRGENNLFIATFYMDGPIEFEIAPFQNMTVSGDWNKWTVISHETTFEMD